MNINNKHTFQIFLTIGFATSCFKLNETPCSKLMRYPKGIWNNFIRIKMRGA